MISERKREMIVNWARSGYTVEQIAGPLRLDQQVVKSIIEGGYRELPTPRPNVECTPVFIEPDCGGEMHECNR